MTSDEQHKLVAIVEVVAEAVRKLDAKLEKIDDAHDGMARELAKLDRDVHELKLSFERLEVVLVRGNGRESVVTRLLSVERVMESYGHRLRGLDAKLEEIQVADREGRWKFWGQVAASLGALTASLVALFRDAT